MSEKNKILLIGYGNPGRQDDGLGPALVEKLGVNKPGFLTLESNYQLTVEDAYDVALHEIVIFVDAVIDGKIPYSFQVLHPRGMGPLLSHSLAPQSVLYLARTLFCATTKAYLLGIRGYEFDQFEEKLSSKAGANLNAAYDFLIQQFDINNTESGPVNIDIFY
ncbi:MAG: hydrogenase maturation protease [Desulfobacteraceae bacterium]|nr:hydrogenase maturation protease [Desulfobacteraceae bacterium]